MVGVAIGVDSTSDGSGEGVTLTSNTLSSSSKERRGDSSLSDPGRGMFASSITLGIVGTSDEAYKLAASVSISFSSVKLVKLSEGDNELISSGRLGALGLHLHSAVKYSVSACGGVEGQTSAVVYSVEGGSDGESSAVTYSVEAAFAVSYSVRGKLLLDGVGVPGAETYDLEVRDAVGVWKLSSSLSLSGFPSCTFRLITGLGASGLIVPVGLEALTDLEYSE